MEARAFAEAVNCGTHILIKTNVCPPRVGICFPAKRLPPEDISLVQGQRAIWLEILSSALSDIEFVTLEKAVVLLVFRSPYRVFDPVNIDTMLIFNTLVYLKLLKDDSSKHVIYMAAGTYDRKGGTDIYVGPPGFANEAACIATRTLQTGP